MQALVDEEGDLVLHSLWHWQPVKFVSESRRDVIVAPKPDDESGGSI